MKKKITLMMIVFCAVAVAAKAQTTPPNSNGFNAGSATASGISAVLGQPFGGLYTGGGYAVAEGVSQAQLMTESFTASVILGEAYTGHGFSIPAATAAGAHTYSQYLAGGAADGYDLLRKLVLRVIDPSGCGGVATDGDGNLYGTVSVAGYCWTQENLRATHYADGVTEIENAGVYSAPGFDDEAANEATYGRLYTWYSAVGLPEDGSGTLIPDADGYVQGVCPNGWHIPTAAEMDALNAQGSEDLRTAELWVAPNGNTNSTGFTSLPAGKYNASTARYERILLDTGYWSVAEGPAVPTTVTALPYYCNLPMEKSVSATDMLSVRCVKNS